MVILSVCFIHTGLVIRWTGIGLMLSSLSFLAFSSMLMVSCEWGHLTGFLEESPHRAPHT
jgi:hypothetical protein